MVSLLGGLFFALAPLAVQPGTRGVLAGGCLLLCAVFWLLLWRVASLPLTGAVLVAAWAASTMTGLAALGLGSGVHSQVLGVWPLLITVAAVIASVRAAALLAPAARRWPPRLAVDELTRGCPRLRRPAARHGCCRWRRSH